MIMRTARLIRREFKMRHITHQSRTRRRQRRRRRKKKRGTGKQLCLVNWATCPCAVEAGVTLQARGPNRVQRRRCEPELLQSSPVGTIALLSLYMSHVESSVAACMGVGILILFKCQVASALLFLLCLMQITIRPRSFEAEIYNSWSTAECD